MTWHPYDDMAGTCGRLLDVEVEDRWTSEIMTCVPIREFHVILFDWPIMAKGESKFVRGRME